MFTKGLGIEVIGTATTFAEALTLTAALKPDVVLMDLHMRDEREYPPELVKSQIRLHTKCIVAMSLWNDDDAKDLAESFGAHVLLDKMKLYSELIPAVKEFCPEVVATAEISKPFSKSSERLAPAIVEARLDPA